MEIVFLVMLMFSLIMIYITSKYQSKNKKSSKNKSKSLNTRKLNIVSNRKYDKNINEQYLKIIENMSSSVYPEKGNIRNMSKLEEIFVKEFLYQVQLVRKKYCITLTRYANRGFVVYYNSYFVGRVNLSNENSIMMQVLIGPTGVKEFCDLTFDAALQNIRYWISYIKNHLKEQRF